MRGLYEWIFSLVIDLSVSSFLSSSVSLPLPTFPPATTPITGPIPRAVLDFAGRMGTNPAIHDSQSAGSCSKTLGSERRVQALRVPIDDAFFSIPTHRVPTALYVLKLKYI